MILTACSTSFHFGAQTSIWYSGGLIGGMSDGIGSQECNNCNYYANYTNKPTFKFFLNHSQFQWWRKY